VWRRQRIQHLFAEKMFTSLIDRIVASATLPTCALLSGRTSQRSTSSSSLLPLRSSKETSICRALSQNCRKGPTEL